MITNLQSSGCQVSKISSIVRKKSFAGGFKDTVIFLTHSTLRATLENYSQQFCRNLGLNTVKTRQKIYRIN